MSCIKFCGDLTEQIQVISGDIDGTVLMTEYKDSIIGYKVSTQIIM